MLDKVALVYGQMNEPPGARLRVGLSGLTMAEYFRDEGQDVLLFIDNIFRFTQAGSEVSALLGRMPSAVGLPADARDRDGAAAGAHHLDAHRLGHVGAGDLRSRRRPHRSRRRRTRSPTSTRRPCSRARSSSRASTRPSTRSTRTRARCSRASSRTSTTGRDAGAARAPALQGAAGHHRDPRHRGALRRGPADGRARAEDPALPLAAELRRGAVHRHARRVREARGHDQAASARSSTASTTTCPSRRSTWSARSTRPSRRAAGSRARSPKPEREAEPEAEAEREAEAEPVTA